MSFPSSVYRCLFLCNAQIAIILHGFDRFLCAFTGSYQYERENFYSISIPRRVSTRAAMETGLQRENRLTETNHSDTIKTNVVNIVSSMEKG